MLLAYLVFFAYCAAVCGISILAARHSTNKIIKHMRDAVEQAKALLND